jgi:hypothetical protein
MPLYAPFGNAIFSETLFGIPPTVSTYTQLTVQPPVGAQGAPSPYAYSGLQIDWQPAPVNQFSGQVLVRSAYGIPTSIYDGTVLVSQLPQATPQAWISQFVDTGLNSGQFYYYALFVYSIELGQWVTSGTAQGLVLIDWGFGSTYQTWMPEWYLDLDGGLATTAQPEGPLVRFLELLGFETDWVRSEIESLILLTNVDLISGALLPYMGGNLGVTYEPVLGMTRTRVLVKNAIYLYKNKGTAQGIAAAASAFSGYGAEVTIGKNLEIQLDDSAFDRSTGHWTPASASSTISTVATTALNLGAPHLVYNGAPQLSSTIVGYLPNNNSNVAVISAGLGAGAVSWSQLTPPLAPSVRTDAAMAYDTSTSSVYLFGGYNAGSYYSDTWALNGTTWSNVSPAANTPPSARQGHAMAYDSNTGVVILFGGSPNGSQAYNDTWQWNGTTWTQLTPTNQPSARLYHSMTYDSNNQTIVLFGGQSAPGGTTLSDTWIWNGSNWVQQFPAQSPIGVWGHASCYNSSTNQVIITGGYCQEYMAETWAWNGTTWSQITGTPNPTSRTWAAMAYDPSTSNCVLFGGFNGSNSLNDTWTLSNSGVWSQQSPPNSPPVRCYAKMGYESNITQLVMFGGLAYGSGGTLYNDVWEWNGSGWSQVTGTTPPSARWGFDLAFTSSSTFVLFGGYSGAGYQQDTWTCSGGGTWTQQNLGSSPSARYGAVMVYDPGHTQVVLFGGISASGTALSDTWTWNGSTWTLKAPATSPPARWNHAMSYDATASLTLLFGGQSAAGSANFLNDMWSWNGTTWAQVTPAALPGARIGHSMVYSSASQRLVLFGGSGVLALLSDTWVYNGTTWTQQTPITVPTARLNQGMIYDTTVGAPVIFGGYNGTISPYNFSDVWEWTGSNWSNITPATSPPGRQGMGIAYDTALTAVVVVGGAGSVNLADTWLLTGASISASLALTTCTSATAPYLGIPVTAGERIVLSAYFRPYPAATPSVRSFYLQLDWYGTNGVLLSSTAGSPVTEVAGSWTRAYVTGTAPANALTVGRTIKSSSNLSGDLHLLDAEQVEISTQATPSPTSWEPPRDIKVNLFPLRQNLIPNPQGLGGSYGWTLTNGTFTGTASLAYTWPATCTGGFILTAVDAEGNMIFSSSSIPVNAGVAYTFSAYAQPATTARTVYMVVQYYNAAGAPLGTGTQTQFNEVLGTFTRGANINTLAPEGGSAATNAATATVQIIVAGPFNMLTAVDASFETGIGTAVNVNTSIAVFSTSTAWAADGTHSLLVTSNSSGNMEWSVGGTISVVGGSTYSATVVFGPDVNTSSVEMGILQSTGTVVWQTATLSASQSTKVSISTVLDPTCTTAKVVFVVFSVTNGRFVYIDEVGLYAGTNTTWSPGGEQHAISAIMLEPEGYLRPYFDANFSPSTDYSFEGNPNQSISDYYPNLLQNLTRLVSAMPEYTPIGSTFSLVTGSSALSNSNLVG